MEILSYREVRLFSKQATDRILQSIERANGPIVLPIETRDVSYCRRMTREPALVEHILRNPHGLDILYLTVYCMLKGKRVVPLFNSAWTRLGKPHLAAFTAFESMASKTNNNVLATTLYNNRSYRIEAARIKNAYERLRRMSPALIVAEDNFAIIFGKLFRTRVHLLSHHTWGGVKAAQKVWPHVVESFRENPIAIRSRNHGRKIRRLRKRK